MDYKEKIKKLLALAESPNMHEAKAALLKARRLMAEHKISEEQIKEAERQDVVDIHTHVTCSKRREPWIVSLSTIIGMNYCCQAYRMLPRGKQTYTICFIGLREDAEVCAAVFEYAVDSVRAVLSNIKRNYFAGDSQYAREQCDGYGYGFTRGVYEMFQKQQQENESEWGLVLSIPSEVKETVKNFEKKDFSARTAEQLSKNAFCEGREDGRMFDPTKRLQEA